MRRRAFAVLAALSVVVATLSVGVASAEDAPAASGDVDVQALGATYTVTFRNLTGGQYLTPPNYAAHTPSVDVFERNEPASAAVQAVAENGGVPVLAAALDKAVDQAGLGVSGVGAAAPVAPGDEVSFEITTIANHLSVVAMLICTNDGFAGLDSAKLPTRDGQTRTYRLRGYDAGTEVNTELDADLVPAPFCLGGDIGSGETNPDLAESGVIRRHRGITGVGDLDSSFDFGPVVAEVEVTRNNPAATYTVSVTNLTDGQYLTPPNFAAHYRSADVFSNGEAASPAVQGLAENGDVGGLAAALTAALDDTGAGVSGVGAEAPIAPGGQASFEITTTADRLTVLSMIICTNDGFGGLDSARLPSSDGHSRTYRLRAYDAGTEVNTELDADLVPAPFCLGSDIGSGETNPALAENGVITRHGGITGVGDLDDSFDFGRVVGEVEITRHDPAPTYTITIENLTSGQYLTPPNVALHERNVSIFERHQPASAQLQALAENGDVPGMATLLQSVLDDTAEGVSAVAGDSPLAPGASVTVHLTGDASRLSLVAMLICTNDGFAGADTRPLVMPTGATFTYKALAYDAGTEVNTELDADLVPAPFCLGSDIGSGETNPALAEGGVVARHGGIAGVGDLDESFDFRRLVASITVTRSG